MTKKTATQSKKQVKQNKAMEAAFSSEAMDAIRVLVRAMEEEQAYSRQVEQKLEEQRGKVLFADAVWGIEESIGVQELAHMMYQNGLDIGENRLFQWLRGNGYVYRQPCGQNMPSQRSLELGVLEMQKSARVNADGRHWVTKSLRVTPKGQQYFMDLLCGPQSEWKRNVNGKKSEGQSA